MSQQLLHHQNTFTQQQFKVTVLCDHLDSPANQGALFRVCEAFGVSNIIFFGNTIDINSSRLKRTARNTEKKVRYSTISKITEVQKTIQQLNAIVIGLEITSQSKPLQNINLKIDSNIVLIVGNEKNGISKELLEVLDCTYHITMYGENSSMNAIQATGITLFTITNQLSRSV